MSVVHIIAMKYDNRTEYELREDYDAALNLAAYLYSVRDKNPKGPNSVMVYSVELEDQSVVVAYDVNDEEHTI